MPRFLATFRSRNLLFCLELSLSQPKTRHMRAVLPSIDAALNQNWKVQAVFFKLTAHDSFPLTPSGIYMKQTLSTRVRLAQPGLKIFCRPSKAMTSNLSWRDLSRSYDFLIVPIFSSTQLYPSLLKIYPSESQDNPCLHEEVGKILTPSHLANPCLEADHPTTGLIQLSCKRS